MKVREVLEVYHAHPPVGRFPFSLFPFAVWSAYMDQTLSTTTASDMPKEFRG
jgi:hypothetical protein